MKKTVLKLKNISKSFSGVEVLRNIDMEFREGEVHALCGENGAGKSTLMKIIAGALRQTTGEVFVDDEPCHFHSTKNAEKKGISMIYQELNFIPDLTVAENLCLGRYPTRMGYFIQWKAMKKRAAELLSYVGLEIDPEMMMRDLTVAQAQMIEIAKCLNLGTKVIIMDEPTAALTEEETNKLFGIIETLKEQNIAIIYISHRMDEIFRISDCLTVLRNGDFIATKKISETDYDEVVRMMIGREVGDLYPHRDYRQGETVFEAKNLNASFMKDVSFALHDGEILSITGLFGSGNIELAKALYGARKIRSGSVFVHGKEIRTDSPGRALKEGIGLVSDDRKQEGLILHRSIKENISLSSLKQISRRTFIQAKKEQTEVKRYMDAFSVKANSMEQEVASLSGGNQQKVVFSRLEMIDSDICILVEPTRGVDVGAKAEIYAFIDEMTKNGKSVLLVSSDLAEVVGISDRVLVMRKGEIVVELKDDQINQEQILSYASGGVSEHESKN